MPPKSITYYLDATPEQATHFDNLDHYQLLEWVVGLSQMALDARNIELTRPLDLTILDRKEQPELDVEWRDGTAVLVIPEDKNVPY